MELPHLKIGKTGNAKYRRRITSPQMRAMLGKSAVEWSLKTKDPLKFQEAWEVQHARFEAMESDADGRETSQVKWDELLKVAVEHGLARPDASQIGPIDSQKQSGTFDAFTDAALAEAKKLTLQRLNAKFTNNPPASAFRLLAEAQVFGAKRPPVPLGKAVEAYLKDRERRSSYADLSKQVGLVVAGLEGAMDKQDPAELLPISWTISGVV